MQENFRVKGKKLYFGFVDLEKAFDRVPREVIRWATRKLGVEEWLVSAVMSTYTGGKTVVRTKRRTIQPKLDRTDPVKSAASESAIQYRSDTDSNLPWTVRKYAPISKRKCKTLQKWCGACNSAVSG